MPSATTIIFGAVAAIIGFAALNKYLGLNVGAEAQSLGVGVGAGAGGLLTGGGIGLGGLATGIELPAFGGFAAIESLVQGNPYGALSDINQTVAGLQGLTGVLTSLRLA